jgi:uncharacterized protein with von Willebrand factor type A (vWA) domain
VTGPAGPLAEVLDFVGALRSAGARIAPDRVHALLAAVEAAGVGRLYWAGRLTLCAGPADLARYDRVFLAHFGADPAALAPVPRPVPRPARSVQHPFGLTPGTGSRPAEEDPGTAAASPTELLRHRDLATLTAAERAEVGALLALLAPVTPVRRGHRYRPAGRGDLDPRRTLAAALRHGGHPAVLARRRRADRPRRLVLLIDVSGSMSRYADALLRFGHAALRSRPYHTEVFTVGTRLTRLTRPLSLRDPDAALAAAGTAIPDWRGGTRLGESLRVFLARYGHRGTARGAVVVVFSDGWERGDTDLLAEQAARLRRLAYRLVWVSPHAARAGFEPTAAGLAAVAPHLSALVAGHSAAALAELVEELGRRR